jgi:DNA polymerase sigma
MITKKDGDNFTVFDKTHSIKEIKPDSVEVDICPKLYDGTKEMTEIEIKQLTNNIAKKQTELNAKKAILEAINNYQE